MTEWKLKKQNKTENNHMIKQLFLSTNDTLRDEEDVIGEGKHNFIKLEFVNFHAICVQ